MIDISATSNIWLKTKIYEVDITTSNKKEPPVYDPPMYRVEFGSIDKNEVGIHLVNPANKQLDG
jgi:hypothetical protein